MRPLPACASVHFRQGDEIMKTLLIAAAALATLIVTSVDRGRCTPRLPRRRLSWWRWLPRRGRRARLPRRLPRRSRRARLSRRLRLRLRPPLWRLWRLRPRLSPVRLWPRGGRGRGRRRRRRVLPRRLRALCLLQLLLRRLPLLLTAIFAPGVSGDGVGRRPAPIRDGRRARTRGLAAAPVAHRRRPVGRGGRSFRADAPGDRELAAMPIDDRAADRETEPHPARLRGHERLEDNSRSEIRTPEEKRPC